jgi:beta-aspartyl-peptidase (threonine type)
VVAIVVHGGAGSYRPAKQQEARDGCGRVIEALRGRLLEGAAALDVAEAAIRMLEDNPIFNAGTGSTPNEHGEIEMDAIIVCGASLRFGAVAAIQNVGNPISVARRLLQEGGDPALLAGAGAIEYARRAQFPYVPTEALRGAELAAHGTVGAVVLDRLGNVAAATSTGGIRDKRRGRVGDSPLIGCGAIADNALGGASATGHGESLMRIQMTRTVLEQIRSGASAGAAAEAAVQMLKSRVGGEGGVICLDARGRIGFAHNSEHMVVGGLDGSGEIVMHL